MNSSIIKVSEILNKAVRIASAGFSAGYSFDESKAAEYFDELIVNSKYPSPIFSGILIIENKDEKLTVIDGMQRLTTICLLLCALCENYKGTSQKNEDAKNKIYSRFLMYQGESKLKLEGDDQEIYRKILLSQELTLGEKSSNLAQAYKCFLGKMKEHKISGTEFFNVLSKIQFMTVFTDKSEVSARELYQALNNNKSESQINLVYDFIVQKNEAAGKIFEEIENSFKGLEHLFEAFIRDFLTTRIDSEIHNKNALYNNFKNYFYKISGYQDLKLVMEDMRKYSRYYLKILSADFENDAIKEQIHILNENSGKDTYPYLMEVMDDLENSHLDIDAFLNILMMINLFIKSRQEISISNVNIDFANLSKELNKMLILKDYVPEILYENKLTINEINNLSNFEV